MTLSCTPAAAQSGPDLATTLQAMRQQLDQQRARIDALERQLRIDDLRGTGGGNAPGPAAVGRSPQEEPQAPTVAPIFESPGVLTPGGHVVVEPSIQYGYSSSNRVAVVGYTVIPALLIGLLDVREVKRNTTTVATALRYGIGNRLEAEIRLPYVYRSDSTVSREIFTGTATDRAFDASGKGIGDAEAAVRYQLNDGGADRPYFIAGLRYKMRTGRDPFEVVTDCQTRCVGASVTGTGLPLTLPTGSGFRSLQPSLTWMLPSDPAVFFGSFSHTRNLERHDVYRTILAGQREPLGTVRAGDVFGLNLGMGLALNDDASLSFGYDHSSVGRSRQNGQVIPGSVRIQLGTLLIGASYRLDAHRSVSVSVGAGLTRDTPDVTLTVRLPFGL
ncbi:MAG: acetate kinase [Massilia sp.]|nr:acetate kinase [Massilia sp.]